MRQSVEKLAITREEGFLSFLKLERHEFRQQNEKSLFKMKNEESFDNVKMKNEKRQPK